MNLSNHLLSIGGNSIFSDQIEYDPDVDLLLKEGRIFSGSKAFIEMQVNECHWNVAHLFENKVIDQIVIGYALNYEDIWFQHTWGLKEGVIIETSEVNFVNIKIYFGTILSAPHSFIKLCKNNPAGNGKVRRVKKN